METIIVQVVVFQLCFLVVYELLLRKETFFNWNRAYLLIMSIVSLIIPFIKLKSFSKVIPSEFIISLPAIILGETKRVDSIGGTDLEIVVMNTQSVFSIVWIWYAGIVVFTGVLLFKLFKIWKFKLTSNSVQKKGYSIVTLKNSEEAFSFLKSIFLGDKIENTQKESILTHEKVHVKEKHTIDLLWFELLRIVFWFNPLVYIYQKRITEVHEFIADKSASKHQQNYYENLLAKTFNIAQFSVVNQFYSSSLIKKRIIMLTKQKSSKKSRLKYLVVAPVIAGMLLFTSCEQPGVESPDRNTSVLDNIEILKESIAANGEMTKEEQEALKTLLVLTSNNRLIKEHTKDVFEEVDNDYSGQAEVPFTVIDKVPIYPGCDENATSEELKKCFSIGIATHINKNFNTDIAKTLNLVGKQKIFIGFKVDEYGQLKQVKARAPYKALAIEAERVINTLPVLKPGMHNGKAVTVAYSIPVIFDIQ
ncbi:MAG: blaR1 peptidase M56 family protein [Kordia sp.]|nr:MAG: blaR1 peptidase M56 family protein [Kordia sp.]